MSKYVPDGAKLLCSKGVKMSRLKVKSQQADYIYGRLKGTYEDKMESNFICPQQSVAGLALGAVIMLPMGGALTLPNTLMTLVGGLVSGVAGAIKGYKEGAEVGGIIGKEFGSTAGGVAGGISGGVSGAVGGGISGGIDGGKAGAQKGGERASGAGKAIGQAVGSMPVIIPIGGVISARMGNDQ